MPVDLNLPVPGQSPNWANQLNAEIEKINQSTNQGVYYASDYGVVGDGVADDTDTMQALIDLVPDGSTIVAPPGATYRTDGWVVDQKSVHLDLSNARLVKTSLDPIVSASGEWGTTVSAGAASGPNLTVTDTSGFRVGDLVKVFADDVIPDARPRNETEKPRVGEFVIVSAVNSTVEMTVNPPLRDSYSQNIRVAKLIDHPFTLRFGTADFEPTADGALFRLNSLRFPVFQGRILRGPGGAMSVGSCYGADVDMKVSDLPVGDGYGVILTSSQRCNIKLHATRTRHAFSDDCGRIEAGNPDPSKYGRSQDNVITGHSFSSWETAFDTHHGSRGNKFLGCISDGVVQSGGAGFSLRGSAHELIACTSTNADTGFRIMTETDDAWSTSEGHYLGNCIARNVQHGWLFSVGTYVSNVLTATIDGGYFEGSYRTPAYLRNVILYLNNPTIAYKGIAPPSDNGMVNVGRAELSGSMRIVSTDMSQGVNDSIIHFASSIPSPAPRALLDVELKLGGHEKDNTSVLTRVNTAVGKINWKTHGSWPITLIGSPSGGAERFSSTCLSLFGNGAGSSSAVTEMSVSNGSDVSFNRSADAHVTVRCKPTGAGVTIGQIYQAAFDGQLLTIRNSVESNDPFTVPNGTTYNTYLGASVTLQPGESLTLAWVSSLSQPRWEKVS